MTSLYGCPHDRRGAYVRLDGTAFLYTPGGKHRGGAVVETAEQARELAAWLEFFADWRDERFGVEPKPQSN